ncbi:MAG TPA: YbaK/EbsC family protein [Gemmatimonadales bacterium]|nr:YbaK/EbsC family protein [Gemmatimonadales bacterium]
MVLQKLRDYLDGEQVKYVVVTHSPAHTAQEIAAAAHISGKEMAKTVMMKVDGEMVMVVLPASTKVDLARLLEATGADEVELAHEREFKGLFPDCELGAMPPFGNLFGLKTFVAEELTEDEEIGFNAGSATDLIRMRYADYARLVQPTTLLFRITI